MNEQFINNWNSVVKAGDRVYHLGDVALCSDGDWRNIRRRLNGQIYLINGNHEKTANAAKDTFVWIKDYFKLKVDDPDTQHGRQEIVMFHYALRVWDKSHHGSWALWGHSHNSLPEDPNAKSFDIGVDAIAARLAKEKGSASLDPADYRPVSYEEVKKWMSKKNWMPVDHHGGE